jgi:hypothetical protein
MINDTYLQTQKFKSHQRKKWPPEYADVSGEIEKNSGDDLQCLSHCYERLSSN